jgi:hypothetical protein
MFSVPDRKLRLAPRTFLRRLVGHPISSREDLMNGVDHVNEKGRDKEEIS